MGFPKQVKSGVAKELGRKLGFSDASFYQWRGKFGGWTCQRYGGCGSLRVRTAS
jgi:hypothetical protein